jgi:integrase
LSVNRVRARNGAFFKTSQIPSFVPHKSRFVHTLSSVGLASGRAALGTAYKPHSFRHGRAHYLDEQGVKVQDISRFLDHASVDHTMRYLQSMEDESGALGNL